MGKVEDSRRKSIYHSLKYRGESSCDLGGLETTSVIIKAEEIF